MRVDIVGAGPGGRAGLTLAGAQAMEHAALVIGAARVLEGLGLQGRDVLPCSDTRRVAQAVLAHRDAGAASVAVAVSGDVGLYSLAAPLRTALAGAADIQICEHPGVSSLQCLCARLHMPWQDAHVLSAHGRACDVAGHAQCHALTFALTGGTTRAHDVCADLVARGMGDLTVHVGENLCCPSERVVSASARELASETFGDLACLLIENPSPVQRSWGAPGLRDADFTRGEAPMTKEEVRQAAVCKLRLTRDACVWDVGAGTGSVSVECGLAAPAGRVFAVESRPDRAALVAQNARKLGALNVFCIKGSAPEALSGLPAPTHVFVGGSGGRLAEIVDAALAASPHARVCVAAVTVETLAKAVEVLGGRGMADVEVTQLSVAKAREVGGMHMMGAQNPVWLVCGQAGDEGQGGDAC